MGRVKSPWRTVLPVLLLAAMAGVIVSAFFVVSAPPPPPIGSFNAPDATRILFFHVPCAELCTVGFLVALVFAIRYLRTRNPKDDARSLVGARLGLLFGILALVMGMAWAKVEWGAPWNWDPRQTGLALALMTYVAYFALRGAVEEPEKQAALAAVYAVLACPTALFLIFGLPQLLPSLHLKPLEARTTSAFSVTLLASGLCFVGLFAWLYALETRLTLLTWRKEGRLAP
jgi:heme exporter protein C